MREPLVSIIMLTYNHEKYIAQALDSVLMQKVNFDYEILIGDDCSTDNTQKILLEYQKKYQDKIILRLRQKNIGATKNAYELLMLAQGDYLATCEGDDYWIYNKKLQKQVEFLQDNMQFIGCSHNFKIINDEGSVFKKQKLSWIKEKEIFTVDDFDGIYLPSQPSTFVRRNIFKESDESFSIIYKTNHDIGDRVLMAIYLSKGNFYNFDHCWSCYRKGEHAHLTQKVYKGSLNKRLKVDWDINNAIELYLSQLLGREVVFETRRENIGFDGVIQFFIHPTRENWVALTNYYNTRDFHIVGFIKHLIKKILQKL